MRRSILVPESFRALGRWQLEGEAGRRWLSALPSIVAERCSRWGLVVDGHPMHGYNGLAVPVRRGEEPLVLKVGWPDRSAVEQVECLRLWDGRGTVRLVDADPDDGALLLERLDSARSLQDVPLEEAVLVIGRLLRRLAVPAPGGFRSTWDAAAELRDGLRGRWEEAGRPFSVRVLGVAIGLAGEMAAEQPSQLVNRDLCYQHVLRGHREPWLAVDPLPLVGAIEYQTGQLLWTRFDEMADGRRLRRCLDALVEAAGMDRRAARAWALLRSVDYWLWGLGAGLTEDPVRCAHIVEELV
ncbi:aminoglycoside phosphotransferase family protein [Nonomuraea sp. NPDC049649]|uniref:aminoglycoside phosphotransferase family protein n=1 Tax=Nonomuraea sp. NPDC049649 TaxID=3155776 RepID=UPI0034444002